MHNPRLAIFFALVVFAFAVVVALSWPKAVFISSASVSASVACADLSADASLIGNAAFAKDLVTGRTLYEKNADTQLPLASLTKLATTLTAFETLSPEDTITISPEALTPDGDAGLRVGEQWKAEDLLDFTLMTSANDGIHAIALAAAAKQHETLDAFIKQMNQEVQNLGMTETYFSSDTGLDISSTTASAYGSARDVATLIAAIVERNPRLLEATHQETATFTSLSGFTHDAQNTSGAIATLSGAVASKTGYTDLAGGNLAVVFEPLPGTPVVAVVLGSTRDGRDTDIESLAEAVKTALKRAIICGDGTQSP